METQVLQHLYSKYLTLCCKITPPSPSLNFDPGDFKGTGHKFNFCFKRCKLQVIDFPHHFHLLFHLYRALATRFISEICFKLFGSNCTSLSCIKTPRNVNSYFNLYSFSAHLMEMTSLGQKALKGGTTLNKPPIGLHVKILNFNGRFEAFSARYGMFLFHQPIQNRWKFNICFNVWVVFRLVFAVHACKQRPPCFWPVFKPQNAIPTSSHYTGLLS